MMHLTGRVGKMDMVVLWAIHTHSWKNILHLHKSSKSQLCSSRLLQPNPNTRWRLWQTHWQLCSVTDCTASLSGFLCAGLESVNVQVISHSGHHQRETRHTATQCGQLHLHFVPRAVLFRFISTGNIEKSLLIRIPLILHIPELINSTPWFASSLLLLPKVLWVACNLSEQIFYCDKML